MNSLTSPHSKIIFIAVILLLSQAQAKEDLFPKVVNDSCAFGFQAEQCQFQYCDNGIFLVNSTSKLCLKNHGAALSERKTISLDYWSKLIRKSFLDKGKAQSKTEACSEGFYISEMQYVKCGGIYYQRDAKAKPFRTISAKVYLEAASKIPVSLYDESAPKEPQHSPGKASKASKPLNN